MKSFKGIGILLLSLCLVGCATKIGKKLESLHLGMAPGEVVEKLGKPTTVRAAKKFENGDTTEVWEYVPRGVILDPRTYWIYFENSQVVQWGEPGDFSGSTTKQPPVSEYKQGRLVR